MCSNSVTKTLDREYIAIRAQLIDLAASLDRLQRANEPISGDPRMDKIRRAAMILTSDKANRAEEMQIVFSLAYQENWQKENSAN
ncbi:MAG: hypothetical protein ACWGMZ_09355 [Thermoguttaceae bacterium]